MELQLEYVYNVYKNKSFSKAAQVLFVSQPALSLTIAKLENKLGFKIFDRSTTPVSLTLRGRIFMDYIEELYERENILQQRLHAVDDMSYGSLTVGGRISSAYYILPIICGEFHRRYPNIHLILDMTANDEKIANHTADIMLSLNFDSTVQEAFPLLEERLMIAVHKDHPCARRLSEYALTYQQISKKKIPQEWEVADLSIFCDIPFIKAGKKSDSDTRLSQMMPDHKVAPYVIANTSTFDMRYRIMQEGIGGLLVSDKFVTQFPQNRKNIYFFLLRHPMSYRTVYMIRDKKHTENTIVNKFIQTAIECCQNEKSMGQYVPESK